MAAHRYWRVYFDTSGSGALAMAALRFFDSAGNRLDGSGTPLAGTTYSGYPVTNLFDSNDSTFWHANAGAPTWVSYDFLSPVDVATVHLQARQYYATQAATALRIQWADDNNAWTDALIASGLTWAASQEAKAFPIVAPITGTYIAYRITVTAAQVNGAVSCATFGLRKQVGGANLPVPLACASSVYADNAGYAAPMAFDSNNSTFWSSAGGAPQSLIALLGAATTIEEIEFRVRPESSGNELGQAPKDFTISGSNDGNKTWTTLKTVAAISAWAGGESRTFGMGASAVASVRPQLFVVT
jgi:hypothetical protein